MSYARFGWDGSDVYVFMSVGGWLECCACTLDIKNGGAWVSKECHTTQEMIDHLNEHIKDGDTVPKDVFERLNEEDAINFPQAKQEPKDVDELFESLDFKKESRTKNPLLRIIGNVSGYLADFFVTFSLKYGDYYTINEK